MSKKETSQSPAQRNPVAQHARAGFGGGAPGAHKDKKKAFKQGDVKHKKSYAIDEQGVAEANRRQNTKWRDEADQEMSIDPNAPYYVAWSGQYIEEGRPKGDGGDIVAINIEDKYDAEKVADYLDQQFENGTFPDKIVYAKGDTYVDYRGAYVESMRKMDPWYKKTLPAMLKRGEVKDYSKEQGVAEELDSAEYNDEAGMADNNLETLKRAVLGIDELIKPGSNLPEWCQEKIAVAKGMLVNVWDYMKSEQDRGVAEADTKPGWMLRKMRDEPKGSPSRKAFDRIADKQAAMAALKQPSKPTQKDVKESRKFTSMELAIMEGGGSIEPPPLRKQRTDESYFEYLESVLKENTKK